MQKSDRNMSLDRDLAYAGMKLASRTSREDLQKFDVDFYEPSHEWIYDPKDGKLSSSILQKKL